MIASQVQTPSIGRLMLIAADSTVPGPTYSGEAVVRWSLLQGLKLCGLQIGYYSASPPNPEKAHFDGSDLVSAFGAENVWLGKPGHKITAESIGALQSALDEFRPDVVLAFGLRGLRLIRETSFSGCIGVYSIDLEHLVPLYWSSHMILHGTLQQKARGLMKMPKTLHKAWRLREETLREYPKANFVVNSAAHHAAWHRKRHGQPTLYVPNPVEQLFDELPLRAPSQPPRFLLLGGLRGIATTTGLTWFAEQVYPHIEAAIDNGTLEVHLAGRLALRQNVGSMDRVVHRGYIADLADEMSRTTAMLVPTPINLGFRTRVLDAFRHGVTVVAHPANSLGMPELSDGKNALLASSGRDFAEAMLRLAADPAEAQRLGRAAFEQFTKEMNSTVSAGHIVAFINSITVPHD